nr:MAG TPA: hypothetical protein [Caudoviricetes sp.]
MHLQRNNNWHSQTTIIIYRKLQNSMNSFVH